MFYKEQQIGSYTLIRPIGRGGFGEVWLAEKRSPLMTKKVAIKLPLNEQVNFNAIRQEASLWEQASGHSNILPIIDADIYDGQVAIVSEFAEDGSLADKVTKEGQLSFNQAAEMTIGILNGLEFLHSRQIIHRDIKPANILLQGNMPRLADFGISRAMNTSTNSSAIIGTDSYMSPEAFEGKRNVQTDIWSVGVLLYVLLEGRLPFPQEHPSERMFAILMKEFDALSENVPPELKKIINKSLAKLPENRYQSAEGMREDLQKCLINIAHPTFAETEVLDIQLKNLFPVITAENKSQTAEPEKETIVNNTPVSLSPPTLPVIQQESVVTQFKPVPLTGNEYTPVDTPGSDRKTPGNGSKNKVVGVGMAVLSGIVLIGIVSLIVSVIVIMNNNATPSQSTNTSQSGSVGPRKRIAFVTNNASAYWTIARKGVEKAQSELPDVAVEFKIPAEGTIAEQTRIVNELIAGGVVGVAISPVDPANQVQMLNDTAKKATVVTQGSDSPTSDRTVYIGPDNVAAGRQAGEMIKEALPNGGKIMLFVGISDAQNAKERRQGIENALRDSKITIVDTRTDDADQVRAKSNVADAMAKIPDLAGLVGIWSYNGPAILRAVKDAGKAGRIKIVCFEEEDETLAGIKDGAIYGTVVQQPFEFGYQSIKILAQILNGDKSKIPAGKQIFVETKVIKKDNVEVFTKQLSELRGRK